MAPDLAAKEPASNKGRVATRSKHILHPSHDVRQQVASVEPDEEPREEHARLARLLADTLSPNSTPVPVRPKHSHLRRPLQHHRSLIARRRTSISSSPSTPVPIHDAVKPQLSEQDSIFASTYADSDHSVTIPGHSEQTGEGRRRSVAEHAERTEQSGGRMAAAAASQMRRSSLDFSPALHGDTSMSALSSHNSNLFQQPVQTSQPHNTILPSQSQYHRRSLYDFQGLGSLPLANMTHTTPKSSPHLPDTPLRRDSPPEAPASGINAVDYADMDQNAEREQYRSWRKGQAKMNGMTIAESQRRASKASAGVDQIIDAQLPQPDPPVANARSRKASHYLGLFRENEAEEKREVEKKRLGQNKDAQSEGRSQLSKEIAEDEKEPYVIHDGVSEDVKAIEDGNEVTVSREQLARRLPLGLLEEIRNHHHLAPGTSRKIPRPQPVSSQDHEHPHHEDHSRKSFRSEDEDSDQEHISSATYYPHQGVPPADSPSDDQLAERKGPDQVHEEYVASDLTSDVQVSLQSEGTRDYLHGISRTDSIKDFEQLPQPAIALDQRTSDSENESDAYGYDSTVSGEDDETETTPTATPLIKAQEEHHRSSARRSSGNTAAPVGAVELKPYKHQVGGHTPVYRFSRRAVCKQLNSKENMFYETVERHHRDLLGFMPRYIGVLNVTYRKEQKKRKVATTESLKPTGELESTAGSGRDNEPLHTDREHHQISDTRVISHSMQASRETPRVILENNRHLIPDSLFRLPPRSQTPDLARVKTSPPQRGNQSDDESSFSMVHRPSLKPASSWGFTSVNDKLRDRVLKEVFAPPVIHKHDRRDRANHPRSLRKQSKHKQSEQRHQQGQNPVDILSLQNRKRAEQGEKSDSSCSRSHSQQQQHIHNSEEATSSDIEQRLRASKGGLSKSAETTEIDAAHAVPKVRSHHKRRHSGGGLKRKPTDIDGGRGDLEFHETEDEAYTADAEDFFSMDDVEKDAMARKPVAQLSHSPTDLQAMVDKDTLKPRSPPQSQDPLPRLGPAIEFGDTEPRNPETSLVQMDERVVRFLLLEDLTASMQKPCVLDLKMGTRQYGIEASEKKQASQRMKCKTTTSRELGVRVCGMQVYNVREQKYTFEDKYFGRDLEAGGDFQAALTRFFFDGIGHAEALKHIPSILEKIGHLDNIIRHLPGYRLYASSLLMIYDRGDADEQGKVKPEQNEDGKPAQYPDIKLKIVDFANCVTAEDMDRVLGRPCPPSNPELIDRGYLRGLRTLRVYFQRIYQDLCMKRNAERDEGDGMAMDQRGISGATTLEAWSEGDTDDPGNVSV